MSGLTAGELAEYFSEFPKDEELRILVANPKERLFFVEGIVGLTGTKAPVLCIEIGASEPMDEEMVKACEEDEQLAAVSNNE